MGFDIDLDLAHGAFNGPAGVSDALAARSDYRRSVGRTLQQAGLELQFDPASPDLPAGFSEAALSFVAGTPAAVVMVPLHDVRETVIPTNRPGIGGYFDQSRDYSWLWGVRSARVEDLLESPQLDKVARIMAAHGRSQPQTR